MAPFCHDVTHAFFASYVHCADFTKLRDYNVPLFDNFLTAIDTVAAKTLQRVVLHTGGKVCSPKATNSQTACVCVCVRMTLDSPAVESSR